MLRIIILASLLACTNLNWAQQTFEHELLELEKLRFETQDDTLQSFLSMQKVNLYLKNQQFGNGAFEELKRVDYRKLPDSFKTNFLWNAALLSYLNKEHYRSIFYIEKYGVLSKDTSSNYFLLSTLVNRLDTAVLNVNLRKLESIDSTFRKLNCLLTYQNYQRKHLLAMKISSAVIPGLGSMMNGYWLKGTASLLFCSGMVAASYLMYSHQLYVNAITWGLAIWGKFYGGNLRLTEILFEKRELEQKNKLADECELILRDVLQQHPLHFN